MYRIHANLAWFESTPGGGLRYYERGVTHISREQPQVAEAAPDAPLFWSDCVGVYVIQLRPHMQLGVSTILVYLIFNRYVSGKFYKQLSSGWRLNVPVTRRIRKLSSVRLNFWREKFNLIFLQLAEQIKRDGRTETDISWTRK